MNQSLVVILFAVLLSGCVTPAPTPDVVVQVAKDKGSQTEMETIEVNRPIAQITDLLKTKSEECLHKKISSSMYAGTNMNQAHQLGLITGLTPRLAVDKQKTRLTLQAKNISGLHEFGNPPPDGWYYMVVDAYPVGKNKTRVELYYQKTANSYYVTFSAVKNWITGKDMSCPDFANSK